MKTRTKLLTAVLSTVTALSCALTAAASGTTPTITLQGNETAPITLETGETSTATLVLKATDFSTVAGADITLTLPESGKVTLTNATVADSKGNWTLTENENYKIDLANRIIKFVDVFNVNSSNIDSLELKLTFTVSDGTIGSHKIGITADLAADDTKLFGDGEKTVTEGYIVIGRERTVYTAENIVNINSSVDKNTEFIPYGGAYTDNGDNNYTYYTKTDTGDIYFGDTSSAVTVLKCKLPDGDKKVTTFGASRSMIENDNNAFQFGSYVPNTTGYTFGTLVIVGDFSAYKAAKGFTDEQALNRFIKGYDKYLENNPAKTEGCYIYDTYGTNGKIYITKMTQKSFMWKNAEETALQYALRIYGITDETKQYTAVGYSLNSSSNEYSFSDEIKTATLESVR